MGFVALILALVVYLQQTIRALPLEDETDRLRVRLAVEEALSNALLAPLARWYRLHPSRGPDMSPATADVDETAS